MNVSTASDFNLTADEIVRLAWQYAGLLDAGYDPTPQQWAMGRDFFNLGLKAVQTEGMLLHTVERKALALTAGLDSYTLDSDTIDVQFPATVLYTASSVEVPLTPMARDEYIVIPDKTLQGLPNRIYVEKQLPLVTVKIYPVPDTSVSTLNYARVRLLKNTDAAFNPDMHVRWLKTLVLMVSCDIAEACGVSDSKQQRLLAKLAESKTLAKRDDTERGDVRFHIGGA